MARSEDWLNARYLRLDTANSPLTGNLGILDLFPVSDNTKDIGTATLSFKDVFLKGVLSDGINSLSVANALTAYDHVSADGSSHSFLNQSVTTTSNPTFNNLLTTGTLDVTGKTTMTADSECLHGLDITGNYPGTSLQVGDVGGAEYDVEIAGRSVRFNNGDSSIDAESGFYFSHVGGGTGYKISFAGWDGIEAGGCFLGTAVAPLSNIIFSGDLSDGVNATNAAEVKSAYDHSAVTHDYAYISGNDAETNITAAEMEELTNGSVTTLHSHAGGTDSEKVKVDVGATADYVGAASTDGVLRATAPLSYADGGDYITLGITQADTDTDGYLSSIDWDTFNDKSDLVLGETSSTAYRGDRGKTAYDHSQLTSGNPHNVVYSDVKRSDHAHYTNMLASGIDVLISQTTWQDGTTTAFNNEIVNVRNVTASVMPDLGETITGTITVNGVDSDGAVISEVFTFNTGAFESQIGSKQFAIVSSVVVDATGAGTGSYFVGIGDKIGVQNYPLNATGDIIKVSKNGAYYDSSNYSVDVTNGTINDTANPIQADDFYSIWYRPYK